MKINLTKGIVTLTSETDEEAITLFQFSLTGKKKNEGKNSCGDCGMTFKNPRGLRTHRAHIHKVKSPNAERNRQYYLASKAKKAREARNIEVTSANPPSWLSPNESL